MAFPRRLLIPGEDVVVELRPHWAALVVAGLTFLVATAVAVWLAVVFHGNAIHLIILMAWLVVVVAGAIRRLVWWLTSIFVVTTNRVVHREGFIAKRSMEIPLGKINDVRFEQGFFDRIVGAGTLVIQSASEAGREEFEFVRHPEEVQKTIYEQTERSHRGGARVPTLPSNPSPRPPGAVGASNVTSELERLAELRARGVLTEDEFQAQKARILGPS